MYETFTKFGKHTPAFTSKYVPLKNGLLPLYTKMFTFLHAMSIIILMYKIGIQTLGFLACLIFYIQKHFHNTIFYIFLPWNITMEADKKRKFH